jgi:hypothetical protein
MSSMTIALVTFGCIFGGALLGMFLRATVPGHHLSQDSKDIVKVAMGLIATMAALILGLLVASAKGSYDTEKNEVIQIAAKIAYLDRVLANYGPETAKTRELLRRAVERALDVMWPDGKSQHAQLDPGASGAEALHSSIQKLSPQNDVQVSLKSQAVGIATDLGQLRWLMFEQTETSISMALLIVVISWLAIIFVSFGLFAPSNVTVIAALILAALSVSGAVFLILELDEPFDGVIRISNKPMHSVLSHLGK